MLRAGILEAGCQDTWVPSLAPGGRAGQAGAGCGGAAHMPRTGLTGRLRNAALAHPALRRGASSCSCRGRAGILSPASPHEISQHWGANP